MYVCGSVRQTKPSTFPMRIKTAGSMPPWTDALDIEPGAQTVYVYIYVCMYVSALYTMLSNVCLCVCMYVCMYVCVL